LQDAAFGAWGAQRVRDPTKVEAVQKMRRFMKTREGSVRIHKVNGKIQV
jgi:hypothetical protein